MGNQYLIQKGRRAGECNILRSSSTYPRPPRLLPDPPDTHPADSDLPIYCSALTKEEIQSAIKQLRNGKAAGPDNIPAETLKVDIRPNVEMLYPLFNKIWDDERVQTEWKESYLIKLPKKGDLRSCSNYRGMTLLSISGKVINRVLLNKMPIMI